MIFSTTLLALVLSTAINSATAVDIQAFSQGSCAGGAFATCSNIPRNVCCNVIGANTGAFSGRFTNLPGGSRYLGYQTNRNGQICGTLVKDRTGSGTQCMPGIGGDLRYSGFAWTAAGLKRAEEPECTGTQEADTITFADGTVFELAGMSTEQKVALWELAVKSSV